MRSGVWRTSTLRRYRRPVPADDEDYRDELPEELDAAGYVGPYQFPDNSRRRWPGGIYLGVGLLCLALWFAYGSGGVLVNRGFLIVGLGFLLVGAYHFAAGWHLQVR